MTSNSISFPDALLGIVLVSPAHGYDLKQTYDDLFGQSKTVLFGQIYSTLARLKRDGYILECANTYQNIDPRKKLYQISEQGKEKFYNWIETPENASVNLQFNLFAKVIFHILLEQDVSGFILHQKNMHLEKMHELTDLKTKSNQKGQIVDELLYDHAIGQLESQIKWMDLVLEKITTLKEEINGTTK